MKTDNKRPIFRSYLIFVLNLLLLLSSSSNVFSQNSGELYQKFKKDIEYIDEGLEKYNGEPNKQLDTINLLKSSVSKNEYVQNYVIIKHINLLLTLDLSKAKNEINKFENAVSKQNDPYLWGLFYDVKGNYYLSIGECDSIGIYFNKVKSESSKIKENQFLKTSIFKLGIIGLINEQYCKEDFKEAILMLKKYSDLLEDKKDIETYLFYLNTLGALHIQIGNFEESIKYYEKALNYTENELKNKLYIASELNSLGVVYHYMGNRKKSMYYIERALTVYKELPINDSQLAFMFNMTDVYIYQNDYSRALILSKEMLEKATLYKHSRYISQANRSLGEIYLALKKTDLAMSYIQTSISESEKHHDGDEAMYGYDLLSKVYFQKGDYFQASNALKRKFEISDSLSNLSQMEGLQNSLIEYETEKKEIKIELLNKENQRKKAQFTTITIIFISVLFGLVFLIFYRRKMAVLQREVELSKLSRAQINPHFLNNAFTNIQALAMQDNKSEEIIDLTSGVSRFSRLMLESTIQDKWSLKLELDLLKHFCSIYTQKYPNKYNYKWNINLSNSLLNSIKIPSAILQPIMENAFEYSESEDRESQVLLNIQQYNNEIKIEIINSIGAQKKILKRQKDEKSRGMEIVEKRILLYNKNSRKKINYTLDIRNEKAFSTIIINL